jgi:hypothetical protein
MKKPSTLPLFLENSDSPRCLESGDATIMTFALKGVLRVAAVLCRTRVDHIVRCWVAETSNCGASFVLRIDLRGTIAVVFCGDDFIVPSTLFVCTKMVHYRPYSPFPATFG